MSATATFAQAMLRNRRERDRLLGADLFVDPAWDMLLQLHAAEAEGRVTHEEELGVPPYLTHDVARRWVRVLEDRGLVARGADALLDGAAPGGRVVSLTREARLRLDALIGKWE